MGTLSLKERLDFKPALSYFQVLLLFSDDVRAGLYEAGKCWWYVATYMLNV